MTVCSMRVVWAEMRGPRKTQLWSDEYKRRRLCTQEGDEGNVVYMKLAHGSNIDAILLIKLLRVCDNSVTGFLVCTH
jgi:hypothetical protein